MSKLCKELDSFDLRCLGIDPESKFLTSDGYLTVKYRLNVLKRLKRLKIERKKCINLSESI